MVSSSNCSLFGMVRHHVTTVAAILVCNLLLCSAHTVPSAAMIKQIAAKHSHGSRSLPSSLLDEYYALLPPAPSSSDVRDYFSNLHNVALSASSQVTDSEAEAEEEEDALTKPSGVKRFNPAAFFGSRGKRMYGDLSEEEQLYAKRFQQGFVGSRGKRMGGDEGEAAAKRFDPSVFSGSRGKRYIPGLEALLLSQMYKKLDAEKWKRQSLLGFHAARG